MSAGHLEIEVDSLAMSPEKLHVGDPVILNETRTEFISGTSWSIVSEFGLLGHIYGESAGRLSFRAKAQGRPKAEIASISPKLTLSITFDTTAKAMEGGLARHALPWLPSGIGLFVVLCAFLYFAPLLAEGVQSPCDAFSQRAYSLIAPNESPGNAFTSGLVKLFGGPVVARVLALKYPALPASLTCTAYYWDSVIEPETYKSFNPTSSSADSNQPASRSNEESNSGGTDNSAGSSVPLNGTINQAPQNDQPPNDMAPTSEPPAAQSPDTPATTAPNAPVEDGIMGPRFGNTLISRSARAEWHMYFAAGGSFTGRELRSNYYVSGNWKLYGNYVCLTYEPALRGTPNPQCRSVDAHQVGDTWTSGGNTMTLEQGIQ